MAELALGRNCGRGEAAKDATFYAQKGPKTAENRLKQAKNEEK
jgi:hypothetical protein